MNTNFCPVCLGDGYWHSDYHSNHHKRCEGHRVHVSWDPSNKEEWQEMNTYGLEYFQRAGINARLEQRDL